VNREEQRRMTSNVKPDRKWPASASAEWRENKKRGHPG